MDKVVPSLFVIDVPFYDEQSSRHRNILFSTRSGTLREIDGGLWRRVKKGEYANVPASILDDLVTNNILVPTSHDELDEILDENKKFIEESEDLYFVMQPRMV